MKSFVNIKHFKEDINDIDIFNAIVTSVTRDKKIRDKNDSEVTVSALTVQAEEESCTVNLWGKWRTMANYINAGDHVNIIQGKSRDFDESQEVNVLDGAALGYIVLEPSMMIDATMMANIAIKQNHFCFFKYHQRRMRMEKVVNYYIIKGNVVGGVFDEFLLDIESFDFEDTFKKCLEKEKIKFITIDYVPTLKNIEKDVKKDLENLTDWYLNSRFIQYDRFLEPNFISLKYGLNGRMDILFKEREEKESVIVELKTGRSPEDKSSAWIHHKFQMLAYNFMYDSVFNSKEPGNIILYSGSDHVARELSFTDDLKRDFIFLRNKIVSYEKLYKDFDYDTMLSFRRDKRACMNCPGFLKKKCDEMYGIFEGMDDSQRGYYFSFYKAVEYERAASMAKNRLIRDLSGEPDDKSKGNSSAKKYSINDLTFTEFLTDENAAILNFDDNASELREGDAIVLHKGDPEHEQLYKGNIAELHKDRVKVRLRNNYTHIFDKDIKWTLSRFDNMIGANVMLDGLYRFAESDKRFKDLILLKRNPEFDSINIIKSKHDKFALNSAQINAVTKSVCARDYFLMQGPPGTGKTKTIAFIINELIKRKQKVLLSALTNRAVDNVLLMLIRDHGFDDFLRLGNKPSVDSGLKSYLLSERAAEHNVSEIKKLKKRIEKYPLIATTTTSASLSVILDSLHFDTTVIDEASQIPEPLIFSSIARANKFILVGDIYQLGPVVRSEYNIPDGDDRVAGISGLGRTLFERLWEYNTNRYDIEDDNDPCVTLDVQYRMNEGIIRFSNSKFYGDVLKSDESVADSKMTFKRGDNPLPALDPDRPVVFIDVKAGSSSRENSEEAKIVKDIVGKLISAGTKGSDIGVISPFKAQCAAIRRMIHPHNPDREIIVDTVERFQGSEKDVIISSFVVGDLNGLEFLKENDALNRKLNVTLTRARKKLILIGNKDILSNDPLYAELINSIDIVPM